MNWFIFLVALRLLWSDHRNWIPLCLFWKSNEIKWQEGKSLEICFLRKSRLLASKPNTLKVIAIKQKPKKNLGIIKMYVTFSGSIDNTRWWFFFLFFLFTIEVRKERDVFTSVVSRYWCLKKSAVCFVSFCQGKRHLVRIHPSMVYFWWHRRNSSNSDVVW